MAGRVVVCCLIIAGLAPSPYAHAVLGGDAAAVAGETAALQGVLRTSQAADYEVLEITTASGTDIREYLNQHGTVFAVSWKAPIAPDLQSLLGGYFAPYSAALAALDHPGLRRSIRVTAPEVVVESGGHLRAYAGRAYLPAEIPAGVRPAELR